jgi:hypothetical protein
MDHLVHAHLGHDPTVEPRSFRVNRSGARVGFDQRPRVPLEDVQVHDPRRFR